MSVSDDCKQKFMELKRKKTYQYIIFKIDEKLQQITLEKTGAPGASYEDFTAQLPENDCRFGIYDFDFTTEDNRQKSKIFFIAWYVIHLIRHSVLGSWVGEATFVSTSNSGILSLYELGILYSVSFAAFLSCALCPSFQLEISLFHCWERI